MTGPDVRQRAVFIGLMLLAFALRLAALDGPSLRGDEALSVLYARRSLPEIVQITRFVSGHPPLFYGTLHAWIRVAGTTEFAARFFSVWWSVLVLPVAYLLGERWFGRGTGSWAVLLLALSSFQVWHAQDIRSYSMLGALALLSCWAYWRAMERATWENWALYALSGISVVHCHYFGSFVILAQGIYWAFVFWREAPVRRRALWRGSVLSWIVVVSSLLPWMWLARTVVTGEHGPGGRTLSLWAAFRQILVTFGVGYWREGWGQGLVSAVVAALLVWGAAVGLRQNPRVPGIAVSLVVVPLACLVVLARVRPIFRERYLVFSAPAFAVLVGAALADLASRWRARRGVVALWGVRAVTVVTVVGLLSANVWALQLHYLSPGYAKSPQWREAFSYLRERFAPGDVVLLNHQDQAVLYYWGDDLVVLPEPEARDPASVEKALVDVAANYDRIWLLPDTSRLWDRDGTVRAWLDRHAEPTLERTWRGVLILQYQTSRSLSQTLAPLDAGLETRQGAVIRLMGYSLRDDEGQTVERLGVTPGSEVRLTLYWRADSAIADEYIVFCHLLDGTGWLRGQQDNPPRQGTFPTSAWEAGEIVIDVYRVPLDADAPAGVALIEIGMYNPIDGERLAVRGSDADTAERRVLLRDVLTVQP